MTPLEQRYQELDYLMFENRRTSSQGDYLDWHLEKEKIRRILENGNRS